MKWKLFVINYQTQDKYTHKLIVISQEILLRIVSTKYNFIFLCSLHHFKAFYEMQLEQTEKDKLKNIQQILLFCKKIKWLYILLSSALLLNWFPDCVANKHVNACNCLPFFPFQSKIELI